MKKTLVCCDNRGCTNTADSGDTTGWWLLSLHQVRPGLPDLPGDATAEQFDKARWIIRDLCPDCGAKFRAGLDGEHSIVFRKLRGTGAEPAEPGAEPSSPTADPPASGAS